MNELEAISSEQSEEVVGVVMRLRYSDPGLFTIEETLTLTGNAKLDEASYTRALDEATRRSYTRCCITVNGKDSWLQRLLGTSQWIPYTLYQQLKPYYFDENI